VVEGHGRSTQPQSNELHFSDKRAVDHDFGGKANRLYPSTSFAGPPPRSGEDLVMSAPHPKTESA